MVNDFDLTNTKGEGEPVPAGLLDLGLMTPPPEPGSGVGSLERAGDFIGRYELVKLLGEGGFGLVWQARQHDPIRRDLALKVIKPGMDSREVIRRFEAERQALAMMDHPSIASVLDAGTTAAGRPFFVMELVQGEPITAYCDRRRLTVRQRLELFQPVCHAVQHAHQKAILHRDLKPSNILVTEVDGRAVPKVIDFGIAKALEAESGTTLLARSLQTQAGVVVGTPQYMSPEQAGSVGDVDTRSDLYALGVILYELLTGETPLPADRVRQKPLAEVLHEIRETDAMLPSVRVLNISAPAAEARQSDARRLSRELRGDLDWIVAKALEKDRQRRYDTAASLARDLECFLASETVSAAAPTWSYRFSKFARRNRGTLIAGSLIAAVLVTGIIASLWQAARAERSRVEADANFGRARQVVMDYLIEVTGHPRLVEAEFVDLQLDLLQKAMSFYEDAAKTRAADPQVRSDYAWALGALADAHERMGRSDEAAKVSRRAMALEEQLIQEFPDEPQRWQRFIIRCTREANIAAKWDGNTSLMLLDRAIHYNEKIRAAEPKVAAYRHEFSVMLASRGRVLRSMRRDREALLEFEKAVTVMESLIADRPQGTAHRETLARILGEVARCAEALREDPARVDRVFLRSVELQEQNVKELPNNPDARSGLGMALRDYSQRLVTLQRQGEALGYAQRAVVVGERLQKEFPNVPGHHGQLAMSIKALAEVYRKLQRPQEAEQQYQRSLSILAGLARDYPKVPLNGLEYGRLLMTMATWRVEERQWAEAANYYEQTVRVCDRNAAENPRETAGHLPRAAACQGWYEAVVTTGDHAGLARAAQALAGGDPTGWEGYWRAAAWLIKGADMATQASGGEEKARQQAAESYLRQSVECLQQAVLNGYPDLASDSRKPPYAVLAKRADFQALFSLKATIGTKEDHSPKRFSYSYKYSDPGKRIWTKEGDTWTETQPSGKKNVYKVTRRIVVQGALGTEISRVGMDFFVFIPDRNAPPPLQLKMKGKDTWGFLGSMEDVE